MANFFDQFDTAPQPSPAPKANFFDQFDDAGSASPVSGAPTKITVRPSDAATFESRFSAIEDQQRPQAGQMQQLATGFLNQGSAAGQRTTPDIGAHQQNLISADTYESDAGEVLFKDPATGQVIPTDQNKHVVLRDPSDNRVKVFARTEATDEGALSAAGRIAGTGMAAGAVTRRPSIPAPTAAEVTPKASDIFASSKPFYRAFKAEASNIDVPVETATGVAERIRGALDQANLIPELAAPVYSAVGILDKGTPITLDALQNIKRVVGRSFNSPDKNVRDAAAVASREISRVISEVSSTAGKNLRTADEIHSTARSVQELQRKSDVAGLRAGRAGYGGNAVNSMRQVLSPIVQKAIEGRITSFKPNEIAAMREIVEGTTTTNVLRGVGQLSPSKGVFQTGGAVAGAATVSPYVLALPALGAASNKLATLLTSKQIDRLKDLVARRSPAYAQAVERAVTRYENTQREFVSNPTPAKFAAYLSASRQLSSGLARDGVAVTSGQLLKSIQGPVRSGAEDEQP